MHTIGFRRFFSRSIFHLIVILIASFFFLLRRKSLSNSRNDILSFVCANISTSLELNWLIISYQQISLDRLFLDIVVERRISQVERECNSSSYANKFFLQHLAVRKRHSYRRRERERESNMSMMTIVGLIFEEILSTVSEKVN